MNENTEFSEQLVSLSAEVVSAYVTNHDVPLGDLPGLMQLVHRSLYNLAKQKGNLGMGPRPDPAVDPEKSVFPDYIICLEDGKKMKMLKRHLKTVYNMTPDQYRARWELPHDYPVVAPNYAKKRSRLAKQIGLGTGRRSKKRAA